MCLIRVIPEKNDKKFQTDLQSSWMMLFCRGERAFCSHECRYQGMLLEEGMSKLEAEDFYMT